jgi:transcriptional regulator with XRE-family HTH domain
MQEQRPVCPAGRAVLVRLKELGLSQSSFAAEMGVGRAVLWRWLVAFATPHIDNAAYIERRLDVPSSLWATDPSLHPEQDCDGEVVELEPPSVPGSAAPLDLVKEEAQNHGRALSAGEGVAAMLEIPMTPAERAQLRGKS